jgi:hypothetical protein
VGSVGYGLSGNAFVEALWIGSPDNAWAAADDGLLHWNSAEWTWLEEVAGIRTSFSGVWGRSANDVWATSSWSTVARFDGMRWRYMYWDGQQMKEGHGFFGNYPNGFWIADVWGSGPNDVWFVGTGGFVLRWNGTTWAQLQPPAMHWLNSVHGSGPNDVWTVGHGGTIFHFNGTTWTNHTLDMAEYLNAVWVAGPSDAWAVGSSGMVLRWNGTSWTQVPVPTQATLNDIHGTGPNDVWAVGAQGTLLHWNGSAWMLVRSGASRDLLGVFATDTGHVWFSGSKGAILRR